MKFDTVELEILYVNTVCIEFREVPRVGVVCTGTLRRQSRVAADILRLVKEGLKLLHGELRLQERLQ